jgi:hypothetical protein
LALTIFKCLFHGKRKRQFGQNERDVAASMKEERNIEKHPLSVVKGLEMLQ